MNDSHLAILRILEGESDFIWIGNLQKRIKTADTDPGFGIVPEFKGSRLYTVLDRMQERGLIESEKRGIAEHCPQYRFVRIAEKGRRELKRLRELLEISPKPKEETMLAAPKERKYNDDDRTELVQSINRMLGSELYEDYSEITQGQSIKLEIIAKKIADRVESFI